MDIDSRLRAKIARETTRRKGRQKRKAQLEKSDRKVLKRLSTRISTRRKELGLSLDDVADRCGLSRSTIHAAEQGSNPTLTTVLAVTNALNLRLEEVLEDAQPDFIVMPSKFSPLARTLADALINTLVEMEA